MEHKIFLPSNDEMLQLMENAWQEFCQKAGAAGMPEDAISLMHDVFLWGYCSGYNDTLCIIRDQMSIDGLIGDNNVGNELQNPNEYGKDRK